eukprot:Colp12_sorted_trinity150504_noHs@31969
METRSRASALSKVIKLDEIEQQQAKPEMEASPVTEERKLATPRRNLKRLGITGAASRVEVTPTGPQGLSGGPSRVAVTVRPDTPTSVALTSPSTLVLPAVAMQIDVHESEDDDFDEEHEDKENMSPPQPLPVSVVPTQRVLATRRSTDDIINESSNDSFTSDQPSTSSFRINNGFLDSEISNDTTFSQDDSNSGVDSFASQTDAGNKESLETIVEGDKKPEQQQQKGEQTDAQPKRRLTMVERARQEALQSFGHSDLGSVLLKHPDFRDKLKKGEQKVAPQERRLSRVEIAQMEARKAFGGVPLAELDPRKIFAHSFKKPEVSHSPRRDLLSKLMSAENQPSCSGSSVVSSATASTDAMAQDATEPPVLNTAAV